MTLQELFPKFNVKIAFKDLGNSAGEYWHKSDFIVLDADLKRSLPGCAKIVLIHEMIHSTGSNRRLMRINRLRKAHGLYVEGSLSYRLEECIAEIATMIATVKLGLYNDYSRAVIIPGLKKNYTPDMYIPVRELRAALKYFSDDATSFEEEIEEVKTYLDAYMDIKFSDSYEVKNAG